MPAEASPVPREVWEAAEQDLETVVKALAATKQKLELAEKKVDKHRIKKLLKKAKKAKKSKKSPSPDSYAKLDSYVKLRKKGKKRGDL